MSGAHYWDFPQGRDETLIWTHSCALGSFAHLGAEDTRRVGITRSYEGAAAPVSDGEEGGLMLSQ